jgi:hypothetical protein
MSYIEFAHLTGSNGKERMSENEQEEKEKSKKAKSRAEEEEDEKDAEEDDPDAEGENDEKDEKKGKKAKKAESEEDDPDAEDDNEDEPDAENEDVKKGRRAERKRAASIFGSKYAASRPDMAAHLAFNTRLSASEAINTMKALGSGQSATQRVSLDSRMQAAQQVRLGPDAQQPAKGSASAIAQQMADLYDANRGAKK